MAKTPKYDDGLMLEAVIRYADVNKGPIKAVELAAWASQNIPELKGVQYYHFLRPHIERDPNTRQRRTKLRECTLRLHNINKIRKSIPQINNCLILDSNDYSKFFDLDFSLQKREIEKARIRLIELLKRNEILEQINAKLKDETQYLLKRNKELESKQKQQDCVQAKLQTQLAFLLKATDEEQRIKCLSSIGIDSQNGITLLSFFQSQMENADSAFSINHEIKKSIINSSEEFGNSLSTQVLNGLDF